MKVWRINANLLGKYSCHMELRITLLKPRRWNNLSYLWYSNGFKCFPAGCAPTSVKTEKGETRSRGFGGDWSQGRRVPESGTPAPWACQKPSAHGAPRLRWPRAPIRPGIWLEPPEDPLEQVLLGTFDSYRRLPGVFCGTGLEAGMHMARANLFCVRTESDLGRRADCSRLRSAP